MEGVSIFFFVNSRSGRFLAPALAWTGYWAAHSLIKVVEEHLWATSKSLILFLLMLCFSRNDWSSPSAGRGSEAAVTPASCRCVSRVTRFGLRCLVLPASLSGCQTLPLNRDFECFDASSTKRPRSTTGHRWSGFVFSQRLL